MYARAVRAHIAERGIAGAGLGRPLRPGLGVATPPLDHALNLPRRNGHAARLRQMSLGFQAGRLIRTLQTDQLGQGRGITAFQAQGRGRRIMACVLARVVVIIPPQLKAAKDALHPQAFPALAPLPGFGLLSLIRTIGGWLEQPADQGIGGFENRRAHQEPQLGDGVAL